jgi:hypothetical protein
MYHITDTKKYIRCPRLFVLETQAEKQEYRPYVRLDEEITALAAEKLHVSGEIFTGARGDEPQKAVNALETADWLIKARFEYGGLRIKVPFLHRTEEGWEIYFLFAGLYPHANDMHFYTSTAWVLKGCGIEPVKWHVIHLNADYVRGQQLDTEELFIISDSFYNSSNNPTKPVKETIEEAMRDMTGTIAAMDQCLENEMPAPVRTQNCTGRQKCRHIGSCDIKAVALRCFRRGDFIQPHILAADVGDIRRKLDLIPAVLLTKHLDLGSVRKTGNNVIPDAGTGADIQIAAVRCYSSGQDGLLCLLILISDFHSTVRDRDMKCRKKISKELRILHHRL